MANKLDSGHIQICMRHLVFFFEGLENWGHLCFSHTSNINLPMHKVCMCGIFQKKNIMLKEIQNKHLVLNVINKVYHLVIKTHLC